MSINEKHDRDNKKPNKRQRQSQSLRSFAVCMKEDR